MDNSTTKTPRALLPEPLRKLLASGTHDYPHDQRRNLIVINVVGFLATISSLNYAAFYAHHDFNNLMPLVVGNVVSATLTAITPLFHRFGRLAAMLFLVAVLFSTIFYFIYFLGRDAGVQLNYLGAAAVVMVVCGLTHLRLAIAIVALAAVLHLIAWYSFQAPAAGLVLDPGFSDLLYGFSAVSIMGIIFVVYFYALTLVRQAEAKTENLLHNVMPVQIAERLKAEPEKTIADRYEDASVLFADLTGFTPITTQLGPHKTVQLLDELFSSFDALAQQHHVEKIKTIGDAYMAVSGIPETNANQARNVVRMAQGLLAAAKKVSEKHNAPFQLRIGIASGPVTAGIIGKSKFSYDVWGETVNLAARLEPQAKPGHILVNEEIYAALKDQIDFEQPIQCNLKGIGQTNAYPLS